MCQQKMKCENCQHIHRHESWCGDYDYLASFMDLCNYTELSYVKEYVRTNSDATQEQINAVKKKVMEKLEVEIEFKHQVDELLNGKPPTSCKSEEGVTEGLVDSLIYICRVLSKRNLNSLNVQEALKDLRNDSDVKTILKPSI